jgi:hypothetical protein
MIIIWMYIFHLLQEFNEAQKSFDTEMLQGDPHIS